MKQITLDYDLYLKEISEAKIEGFNVIPDLYKKVTQIHKMMCLSFFEKSKWDEERRNLTLILNALEKKEYK